MKLLITKKGIVDCTSDSREHPINTLRDGIESAIKIFDKEIVELDYTEFYIGDSNLNPYNENSIKISDKKTCLKLLNYFKENPEELTKDEHKIHIHVALWNFFNDGNNCSDYIDVYTDRLEVSCQDWYNDDKRDEFHEYIKELIKQLKLSLDNDYSVVINDSLISLHISVTEKCSANCKTCCINRGLQRELRKEDWSKLPEAEQYAIGGGEPAEYPMIVDFVEYLKKERKGYVSVTTNGQKIIEFKTLPDKIAVSIDGLTQEEHEITHSTDLKKAESTIAHYRNKGIKVCINHILHKKNIDNVKEFTDRWLKQYEVNFVLFTGDDNLKPTFDQLKNFGNYFYLNKDKKILIDSCMGGILKIENMIDIPCIQGLFSKYYRFGTIAPCSHSAKTYPNCKIFEEYTVHLFKTIRPLVFIYEKDGTSGAHEWAFKAGLKGKIRHNVEFGEELKKDTIYILTREEEETIRKPHYYVYFENKMPTGIHKSYFPLQGRLP